MSAELESIRALVSRSVMNAVDQYARKKPATGQGNPGDHPTHPDYYVSPWIKGLAHASSLALTDAAFRPNSANAGVRMLNRITRAAVTAAMAAWMAQSSGAQSQKAQAANTQPASAVSQQQSDAPEVTPSDAKSFQDKWGVDCSP